MGFSITNIAKVDPSKPVCGTVSRLCNRFIQWFNSELSGPTGELFEQIDKGKGERVEEDDVDGGPEREGVEEAAGDADEPGDEDDGEGLSRVGPGEVPEGDEGVEDGGDEGGVHGGGAVDLGEGEGDVFPALLDGHHEGADDLRGVAAHGREDEAQQEGGDPG